MSHFKVFKSGNNYEIYEYEKMPPSEKLEEYRKQMVEFKVVKTKHKSLVENYEKDLDRGVPIYRLINDLKNECSLSKKERKILVSHLKAKNMKKFNLKTDENPIDLKTKRRKQRMTDNYNIIKRMAREYFSEDSFFVTLTYQDRTIKSDAESLKKAEDHFQYLWKKMRRKMGKVSYLAVRELQKDGTLHYHALVKCDGLTEAYKDIPPPIKKGKISISSEKQKEYERYFHETYWTHGWVNVAKMSDCDNVGAYLTKYMTKGDVESMEWLRGRKMYLPSKDVKKVEALDPIENSEIIKSIVELLPLYQKIAEEDIYFELKRKRVFTNGYKSEFNGQVKYFDINISRMTEN